MLKIYKNYNPKNDLKLFTSSTLISFGNEDGNCVVFCGDLTRTP